MRVRDPDQYDATPRRMSLGRKLTIMAASGLATLALGAMVFAMVGLWIFGSAGPALRPTTVVLRHGASMPEIAAMLEDLRVVRSASVFMAAAQISGSARKMKAGEYEFPVHASIAQVLSMISHGRTIRHFVTIPEGRTSEQAVQILMADPILSGSAPVPPEGSLLPETYEVQRGEDRAEVLSRMQAAQEKLIAQLWPKRKPGLPIHTPQEAVTLASIVEKETGLPGERPRVAAVFVNRLEKGIKLESDPTIIYGLTRGRPLGRGIRQSELVAPTPYNTYVIPGLPPTPIGNPGRAAIAAVLDPAPTNDIFFVANGTGGHAFAATLAEHQHNVERWRQIEQQRQAAALGEPAPAVGPLIAPSTPPTPAAPGMRPALAPQGR